MAIVLVVIFGMLVGAIATYAGVSFRHTGIVRSQTEMRASAEAGLRVTIDQLERRQTLCGDFSTVPPPLAITPNEARDRRAVHQHRRRQPGRQQLGVILTGAGASPSVRSLISAGAASELWTRKIGGRIYMGAPEQPRRQRTSSCRATSGTTTGHELREPAVAPVIPDLTIEPQPPHGHDLHAGAVDGAGVAVPPARRCRPSSTRPASTAWSTARVPDLPPRYLHRAA